MTPDPQGAVPERGPSLEKGTMPQGGWGPGGVIIPSSGVIPGHESRESIGHSAAWRLQGKRGEPEPGLGQSPVFEVQTLALDPNATYEQTTAIDVLWQSERRDDSGPLAASDPWTRAGAGSI